MDEVIKFDATITYQKYYNPDSSWGAYLFSTENDIPHYTKETATPFDNKSDVEKKFSSLSGKMQELVVGGKYTIKATYKHDKTYGDQYVPIAIYALAPQTEEDQIMFLKSLISESLATNLTKAYPNIVNDVISGEIKDIDYNKVKGVGKATWERIKETILNNYLISDIIIMLKPLGVTYNMIRKLLTDEPNPALLKKQLEENPYVMTRIHNLGFRKIDGLALKLKPQLLQSPERLVAFVTYYLKEIGESDGHTWVSKDILKEAIDNTVTECSDKFEWLLENNDFLYIKDDKIGLKYYYDVECKIVDILYNKSKLDCSFVLDSKKNDIGIKKAEEEQGFEYTEEQRNVINTCLNRPVSVITGKAGCVDCDTEFFTGTSWKKISEYKEGDLVLQYNKDGSAELVKPLDYIRQKEDVLYHFETKYGLDQCLSMNHNCVIMSPKNYFKIVPFSEIYEKQQRSAFKDRFITAFKYSGSGIEYSDDMIRLLVAASADATYSRNSKVEGTKTYHRARFRLKKSRKFMRLIFILKRLNLEFELKKQNNEYFNVHVKVPFEIKQFPKEWYNCTQHQLNVIASEVMYWDGYAEKENRYSTTIKENADFIQFVFSSIGKRATIITNDRRGRKRIINGKEYVDKSIEYSVHVTDKIYVGMTSDNRSNHKDTVIEEYKTKDGYEYCFTVPSHMLVLRRNNKIFVTGNCGKSTIMRGIIKAYCENKHSVSACALSAMAAKRIVEATGYPAMTIHRTLGCIGLNSFTFNKDNHMIVDVAFLDEGSMVNARLFLNWLEAIDDKTRIIISGDHKQLPPIGYGNVFSDIIDLLGNKVVSKLTEPMRQAKKSGILMDANVIRENKNPLGGTFEPKIVRGELQDMFYMFRTNRQSLFDIATKTFLKTVETDGLENVVIIVPRKSNCLNSTFEINKFLQEQLLGNVKEEIGNYENTFKLGARVMQTVNDYQKNVFNGEIGYIMEICNKDKNHNSKYCVVKFNDTNGGSKFVEYTINETSALDLAYALTCHKCQGSGYKTVIGIIDNTHYALLDNCMLYTLITRAKKRCLLLAEPQAFLQCIRTSHNSRNTWLSIKYDK